MERDFAFHPGIERDGAMSNADHFTITDALIHRYSRRGNFHTDADHAAELGLPGLVAQGTQASGRAFGKLLEHWGEALLERGRLDLKFVGMVVGGDEIATSVAFKDADEACVATITVDNVTRSATAVVGTASIQQTNRPE